MKIKETIKILIIVIIGLLLLLLLRNMNKKAIDTCVAGGNSYDYCEAGLL